MRFSQKTGSVKGGKPNLPAVLARARGRAKDQPELIAKRERTGRERALIYKMLTLTGLRRGELAALTVGDIHLDESFAFVALPASSAKNRQEAEIPLRDDLTKDLRYWVAEKSRMHQAAAEELLEGVLPMAARKSETPATERLFHVPRQLVKTFDRDLKVAGIPKTDDRGRTLDIHALRHSFASLLSAGGVAPRTASHLPTFPVPALARVNFSKWF
jgi:integrase